MSNFFTNLTDRTLGTAPLVRPAIAPRFASSTNVFLGASTELTQNGTILSDLELSTDPLLRKASSSNPGEFQRSLNQDFMSGLQFQKDSLSTGTNNSESMRPLNLENNKNIKGKDSQFQSELTGLLSSLIDSKELRRSGDEIYFQSLTDLNVKDSPNSGNINPSMQGTMDEEAIKSLKPRTFPKKDQLTPEDSAFEFKDPVDTKRHDRLKINPETSLLHSLSTLSDGFKDTHKATRQEPKIQVTIGRVEVRALMTKTTPPLRKSPANPKPRLSLEDYLNRRSGVK